MRLSVRFTNIKMIMIEEGFCKNAWTSDIKRPEATQRHQSKGKSTGFEYLKYFFVTSFFGAFVNLCFFLFAKIPCTYISILVLLHIICNLFRHVPVNKYLIFWCFFKSLFFYFLWRSCKHVCQFLFFYNLFLSFRPVHTGREEYFWGMNCDNKTAKKKDSSISDISNGLAVLLRRIN